MIENNFLASQLLSLLGYARDSHTHRKFILKPESKAAGEGISLH